MTQVDFYILKATTLEARLAFAARLSEKIISGRHQLTIATATEQQRQQLSHQLWHLRPDAFIAHELVDADGQQRAPVLVCGDTPPNHCHDVLLNLCDRVLENCFSRFNRVVEIVVQEDTVLTQSRQCYKFYSGRKHPINTHNLDI